MVSSKFHVAIQNVCGSSKLNEVTQHMSIQLIWYQAHSLLLRCQVPSLLTLRPLPSLTPLLFLIHLPRVGHGTKTTMAGTRKGLHPCHLAHLHYSPWMTTLTKIFSFLVQVTNTISIITWNLLVNFFFCHYFCFHSWSTVAQQSVPMLCHFEEIRELWDIKKESGKVPVGWMKGHAPGIPKLLWSCDLVAMEARYKHFKMTCHWDTDLTLHVSIIVSYIT